MGFDFDYLGSGSFRVHDCSLPERIKRAKIKDSEDFTMKVVYICSPLHGDIERNVEKAKFYCKIAIENGAVPIAPHVYLTQFLNDDNSTQRAAGIAMGAELLKRCDELWAFGNKITEGMASEIEIAKQLKIPIIVFGEGAAENPISASLAATLIPEIIREKKPKINFPINIEIHVNEANKQPSSEEIVQDIMKSVREHISRNQGSANFL